MTREEMIAFLRRRRMTGGREWPSDAKIAAQLQADGEIIARLEARIAEFEAVLPPFVAWCERIEAEFADHADDVTAAGFGGTLVTFGDLRRLARAALRPTDKGEAK